MALIRRSPSSGGWLAGLLGSREIERRVDENFPTWQEYSEQKIAEAQEREEEQKRLDLPPHRIYVSSPLHGNFVYFFLMVVGLAMGFYSPTLAPALVYAAIAIAMVLAVFFVFRDAVFFHVEGLRLSGDAEMINKHAHGSDDEKEGKGLNFLRSLSRKQRGRRVFRSRLLQIHYQNVLRTFEQGNRRTWVDQDASIAELQTLLSQRGMKLVWTVIEMLPQLGLLGTLIGLMRMFLAFRVNTAAPETEVLAGFATALGTTVMANLFVLVLRPLYMRNERSMNEILSTIQSLMAMFILPTQQSVLERTLATGYGRSSLPMPSVPVAGPNSGINETRLYQTLDELSRVLTDFTMVQQQVDSGTMARETAGIAQEVKDTLRAFQDAVDRNQITRQQRAIEQLNESIQALSSNLGRLPAPEGPANGQATERIERDLTQLRVLTHDTLVLLEQIANRLEPQPGRRGRMLSTERNVRGQVFGAGAPGGLVDLDEPAAAADAEPPADEEDSRIRLFSERN